MSGFFSAGRVLVLGAILICLGLAFAGCARNGLGGYEPIRIFRR